ncbi:enoyl-CoA hydratase-related protein [Myxococcota bacterium]|jgi:enoyl-CoA hydratase/carnithine racemase|nr:enoyl-CoA hydratase-related protein [Myxococcota bacterium]|tara:strand:- start:1087 stop:1902 length:816 start_codon:yes stop_codon:yes gene_type:complete
MVEKLETGTSQVLAELELGVLKVTLNRPEARNALSEELTPALREMVAACSSDDRIRCLLLTGAGKAFCAGGDIKSMGRRLGGEKTAEEKIATLLEGQRTLSGAIHELPIPTLAALPGPAAGAGLGIALACDLRIAGTSAFMATGYVRIGLSGDYGATYFMQQLVGPAKARELFFSGERIPIEQCESLGLVNRVVSDESLQDEAMAWATTLAQGPTRAMERMKKNFLTALNGNLDSSLVQEAKGLIESANSEDHREAVKAFIEKREPTFKGS